MTYILLLFLTYVLHLLLKLNWVCTAVVLVFLLVMQHLHPQMHGLSSAPSKMNTAGCQYTAIHPESAFALPEIFGL